MQFKKWSFLKLAIALGLAGLVVGSTFAWLLPSEYMSKATLLMTPVTLNASDDDQTPFNHLNDMIQQMETGTLSQTSIERLINDPTLRLYPDLLGKVPLEDVIEDMKNSIQINFVTLPGPQRKRATAFDIKFIYPDPVLAQKTVNALIAAFMEQANYRAVEASNGGPGRTPLTAVKLDVLDSANLPHRPTKPNRPKIVALGFFAGVLLAAVISLFRRRWNLEPEYPANVLQG